MNRADFQAVVHMICCQAGGSVVSGHRSTKHNAAVGGHEKSLHLVGLAADIQVDVWETGRPLATYWADRLGVVALPDDEKLYIHLQPIR